MSAQDAEIPCTMWIVNENGERVPFDEDLLD